MQAVLNTGLRKLPVWVVYLGLALPAPAFLVMAATGALGVEPIEALEHKLGDWALKLFIAGLTITPLRRYLGVNLLRFRRAIGVMTFYYIVWHLLVWLILDVQILDQIWADILKRPYITVGMAGFVLTVPLALTSNNRSVRHLGRKWRQLHKLVYPAAILGAVHYIMLSKGFQIEPWLHLGAIAALLLARVVPSRRESHRI